MKTIRVITLVLSVFSLSILANSSWGEGPKPRGVMERAPVPIPNPMIDYRKFMQNAVAVEKLRRERRITEAQFVRMASQPGTIVFDARSDSKFEMLHVKGAKHLSLPDVTATELARIIPDKSSRILIYCNNNFEIERTALPSKAPAASLNLYTFNTLYSYGYENVYELGPLIDIKMSLLDFEGPLAPPASSERGM